VGWPLKPRCSPGIERLHEQKAKKAENIKKNKRKALGATGVKSNKDQEEISHEKIDSRQCITELLGQTKKGKNQRDREQRQKKV